MGFLSPWIYNLCPPYSIWPPRFCLHQIRDGDDLYSSPAAPFPDYYWPGLFRIHTSLELPQLIFGYLRVNLLDLLETFAFFIDLLLYPGSPAGQGGAHLCEGGFVYFVPMIICVLILSGELVSCVQLLEEECAQVAIIFMPDILGVDRDGCPGDRRHLSTVPFDDKGRLQRNP